MDFIEYEGKRLLKHFGLPIPKGVHCHSAEQAREAFEALGPCVVKAQVPIGKRGKAGGIVLANSADEAFTAAQNILGMEISGYPVESLLVEQQAAIEQEFYAAVMTDYSTRQPLILFSSEGGMDIEELAEKNPDAIHNIHVDIERGVDLEALRSAVASSDASADKEELVRWLISLYDVYSQCDADLVEINPLVKLSDGRIIALDCKLSLDDSAAYRQEKWFSHGYPELKTEREKEAEERGFKYIELDGDIGLLANGAGLTMTTMDVVSHAGGRPANFLEIGGEAYTKGAEALDLVLSDPNIKSLVINFCGAFARTDVMTEGIIKAWEELQPTLPVFFSVHGTGEDEAVAMLKERLSITPHKRMEDAIAAAVSAAAEGAK